MMTSLWQVEEGEHGMNVMKRAKRCEEKTLVGARPARADKPDWQYRSRIRERETREKEAKALEEKRLRMHRFGQLARRQDALPRGRANFDGQPMLLSRPAKVAENRWVENEPRNNAMQPSEPGKQEEQEEAVAGDNMPAGISAEEEEVKHDQQTEISEATAMDTADTEADNVVQLVYTCFQDDRGQAGSATVSVGSVVTEVLKD